MRTNNNQVSAKVADAESVLTAIASRFSCRAFQRHKEISRGMLEEILEVSGRAPSGTNTQPWNVYILQGKSRDTLVDKVCAAHDALRDAPELRAQYTEEYNYYGDEWFSPYIDRRRNNGWGLYGALGIQKGEKEKMHAQHRRNFCFFDAPVGLMLTIDRRLGKGSMLDCGTFLQNIMIASRAFGLHTCPQAAWNPFHSIVLPHIGAPDNEMLVTGMSLGFADETAAVNQYRAPREELMSFARWVD